MKKFLVCGIFCLLTALLTPLAASGVSNDLLEKPLVVEKVYQGGVIAADVLDLSYTEVPTLFSENQNLSTNDLPTLCPVPTEGKVVYKCHKELSILTNNCKTLVRKTYSKPIIFSYPETSICKGYKGISTIRRC